MGRLLTCLSIPCRPIIGFQGLLSRKSRASLLSSGTLECIILSSSTGHYIRQLTTRNSVVEQMDANNIPNDLNIPIFPIRYCH